MASRPQYLKRRHHTWYFQISVPQDLHPYYQGRPNFDGAKITRTTGAHDLAVAQPLALRWAAEHKDDFRTLRLGHGEPGSAPYEVYREKLRALRAGHFEIKIFGDPDPEDPHYDPDGERASLEIDTLLADAPTGKDGEPVLSAEAEAKLDAINDWSRERMGKRPKRDSVYGMPFSVAAERCLKEKAKTISGQTAAQYEASHRLFSDFIGDKALRSISRVDAVGFVDAIRDLDPLWGRHRDAKSLPFSELQRRFGGHADGLSNRTINRHLTALNAVWRWAHTRGEVSGDNPFSGLLQPINSKTAKTYFPFTDDELSRLFADKPKQRTLREIPLVALYSGMRLNEVCSLEWRDVKREDDVWYFDITQSKSEAGVRKVPVHSQLAWLLERRSDDPSDYLWPELTAGGPDKKRSWKYTAWFTKHRRDCDIVDAEGPYRKGFHSFRKNATRCLELAHVPQNEAAEVLGHEKLGITYRVYNPGGLTMRQRQKVVETVQYPALEKI